VKPKLLVAELWGLGDLVIATPFLQAASERYSVTVLAKPYARDLQTRFWPSVRVVPFVAPWTAFKHKYRLLNWPWEEILRLRRQLAAERFDFGLSARWDPRDHFLLWIARVKMRVGFPRMGSQLFLGKPLARPDPAAHRYEHWRVMARALGFELPPRDALALGCNRADGEILIHTGAGQPVRGWPAILTSANGGSKPVSSRLSRRARSPNFSRSLIVPEYLLGTIPDLGISPHSAACRRSHSLARSCRNGLRRCIRLPNGSKARLVHTNHARITAGFACPFVSGTLAKRKHPRT
jgi:hypothetical protein